jgi:hypothetical protein
MKNISFLSFLKTIIEQIGKTVQAKSERKKTPAIAGVFIKRNFICVN